MQTLIVLLLVASSLTFNEVLCQDELRGSNDKVGQDNGGLRNIYSQPKHLSPHRMMHFGKRMQSFDVAPAALASPPDSTYPFLLQLDLGTGQVLRSVPDNEYYANDVFNPAKRSPAYSYDKQEPQFELIKVLGSGASGANNNNQRSQQLLQQLTNNNPLAGQKFLRLLSEEISNSDNSNESSSAERAQPSSSNSIDDNQQQQQQITVNTRSPSRGGSTLNLPRGFISSLYGRANSASSAGFNNFNKKAEPKDNFFMHFGRK